MSAMRRWWRRAERVTAEQARQITGIATPFGGISWADRGPTETETVHTFILFLEDRRVLYNAMDLEVVSQVEGSIHEIRGQCTQTLQALPPKALAIIPVRNIRTAARRFHDDRHEEFRLFDSHHPRVEGNPGFFTALGAFRATVGLHVAQLAAHYDIDVEGDLASVLPDLGNEIE